MTNAITLFNAVEISPRAVRAHAMKNCLSIILAVSSLIDRELTNSSRERMHGLRSATLRLRDLLAQDLTESSSSDRLQADDIGFPVAALVTSVTDALSHRAESARVELFVHCGGGEMMGDADALHEVLFNVLANAIDASSPGGAVFLATYVTLDRDQYWVVQDTGRGMSAEEIAEVGQPFRSRSAGGSGLGIAVARATVTDHHGLLRIESAPGSGTTVSIWLPGRSVDRSSGA